MQNNSRYYEVEKAKVYKDLYRPSTSLSRFFKTLLGIMVSGNSPISHQKYYSSKRTR
jgi:hypothetical protein